MSDNNAAEPAGGEDPNSRYNLADICWIMISTALVFFMIPGIGFLYSGMARRKSALSLLWICLMSIGVVFFQWFFFGYSLAFSDTAGPFIGNFDKIGFKDIMAEKSVASPKLPGLVYAVYQGMFACATVALLAGVVAERGKILPCVIFMVVWTTLIYDPIACWTWNPTGWLFKLPIHDFAGGTPVHTAAGFSALAYSLMLGKRRGHGTRELNYRPHNIAFVVLGTIMIWLGWFGFNGGSALGSNLRAVVSIVNTNIAASVGGVFWCLLDYRLMRKWSAVGLCSGAIAGLVAVTPGSGHIPPWAAVIYGALGSACCNYATKFKYLLNIDDALDIFALHGVGGFLGNILTGIFAADYIARLDGVTTDATGGWINQNWPQVGFQIAGSVAASSYAFVGTCLILFVINLIPGCRLRVSPEDEVLGIDDVEIGEFAYDYVKLTRDAIQFETMNNMLQML